MTHLKTSTIGLLGRQVLKQNTTTKTAAKARHIKLGIDVHKRRYVVVRIIDGSTPQAPPQLPFGLGKLTFQVLEREVGDWNRFKNRRQVASYTGLCPREDSTGQRRFQGSSNKHGNRRLRPVLVECLWRLCRFQPEYRGVKKWLPVLMDPKTSKPRRKKIIVAIGSVTEPVTRPGILMSRFVDWVPRAPLAHPWKRYNVRHYGCTDSR